MDSPRMQFIPLIIHAGRYMQTDKMNIFLFLMNKICNVKYVIDI